MRTKHRLGANLKGVEEAQIELLSTGSTVENVTKIDRAMLASNHLRALAMGIPE